MQLKYPSIRLALARATYTLISGSTAVQANIDDGLKTEGAALVYSETGRVSVFEPVIQTTSTRREDETLSLRVVIDIMSGASPSGAAPATSVQTFTSPSGGKQSTTAPYKLPLQDFSDQRVALSLDWDTPWSPTQKNLLGVNFSKETDYTSFGLSDNLRTELNDKLTTLTLGVAANVDGVSPAGGAPQALAVFPAPTAPSNSGDDDNERESDDFGELKLNASTLIGFTQVVNRRLLMQFNYALSTSAGYLNDPYKIVSVVNGTTGAPVRYLSESRPRRRTNQTLFWKGVLHLPDDVVHLSYRYFWDDWGIRAHTADLEYRLELGGTHYLRPHLRYHVQTGADFYRHSLVDGAALPHYASADYRLAALTSYTVGLKYGFRISANTQFGFRVERILQTGAHHPADAIGAQRQVDMYPNLEAYIFQIDFSALF
ncbi:MAG: DUF3570 domain-containing protein [Pseudomonadota bacterium]